MSFAAPFSDDLVGATIRVIVSTRRPGRLIETDGNCLEISAQRRCWSLPKSSNISISTPYVGSAPAQSYHTV